MLARQAYLHALHTRRQRMQLIEERTVRDFAVNNSCERLAIGERARPHVHITKTVNQIRRCSTTIKHCVQRHACDIPGCLGAVGSALLLRCSAFCMAARSPQSRSNATKRSQIISILSAEHKRMSAKRWRKRKQLGGTVAKGKRINQERAGYVARRRAQTIHEDCCDRSLTSENPNI